MRRIIGLGVLTMLSVVSCKKDQSADELITTASSEVSVDSANSNLVEATHNTQVLTNLALSEPEFDFGKIKKGDKVEHVYEVTNTGKNPLIISSVVPTCGCTVPEFTKDPIMPGQKGKVTLKFDSTNFQGIVHKTAQLYANVSQVPIELKFTANIQP